MELATMTIEDYDEVRDLWMNTPGMGLNTLDDSLEGIAKYLRRNPTTCFVARNGKDVLGAILSGHDGRRGFIYHTAVRVSERTKGIGKRLVAKAIEALRNEGINKVAFVVFKENGTGNAFWEALGFDERTDLVYRNKTIATREMQRMDV